jgi:hypothetical protein
MHEWSAVIIVDIELFHSRPDPGSKGREDMRFFVARPFAEFQERSISVDYIAGSSMQNLGQIDRAKIGWLGCVFAHRGSALHGTSVVHAVINTKTVAKLMRCCAAKPTEPKRR